MGTRSSLEMLWATLSSPQLLRFVNSFKTSFLNITKYVFQEFWRNLQGLWQHMLHSGFWSTWAQLVESLDPFGEKNALKTLGLAQGASQEEIRSKYRELTKVHHPDKVKGTQEEKEAAQEKFVQIQQAYEKLSDLKRSRAKANKRQQQESEPRPEPARSEEKIEL